MPERSQGPSGFENPEAGQGGADAVNDTPDVPGHGATPEEPQIGTVRAQVPPGGVLPGLAWLLIVLVVLAVLAYVVAFVAR
jgi:hypothetical protein